MSRYHLSEAYAELYSNKLNEDIDDNLRFIDYMQDEDIQEVVESLYWEFRDYGYTSDGAFDVLKEAASDEALTESVDYLCEGRIPPKQLENRAANRAKQARQAAATTANKKENFRRSEKQARHSERQARVAHAVKTVKDTASKVKNFGTNVFNKVKSYGAGAATAAQLLPGAAATAGKARLTNLLRTGARLAGGAISNVGGAIQRGGEYLKGEIGGRPPLKSKRPLINHPDHFGTKKPAPPVTPPTGYPTSTTGAGVKAAAPSLGLTRLGGKSGEGTWTPAAANRSARRRGVGPDPEALTSKTGKRLYGGALATRHRSVVNKARFLNKEQYELLAQYILEDLIQEGYANDYDSALIILNNLSEEIVGELALNYLED